MKNSRKLVRIAFVFIGDFAILWASGSVIQSDSDPRLQVLTRVHQEVTPVTLSYALLYEPFRIADRGGQALTWRK